MEPNEQIIALLTEVRDELRTAREPHKHKRWFEREPFKTAFSHGMTVCIAATLGYMIHECTGAPVTIETAAKEEPAKPQGFPAPSIETAATSNADIEMSATALVPPPEISASSVSSPPVIASAKVVRPKKVAPVPAAPSTIATALAVHIIPGGTMSGYEYSAPAAPASAPASAAPAPAPTATSK